MATTGLHIVTSNQMEILAAGLAELLRFPPDAGGFHPLRAETVIVQSKGMQRWVSLAVARHSGICANLAFPFPNAFLELLYVSLVGPLPEDNPYDRHALTFGIMQSIPQLLERDAFLPLRRYLSIDQRPLKQYQLARQIAAIFDQYMVFRPDFLTAWGAGRPTGVQTPDAIWQAMLWRSLTENTPVPHRSKLQRELVQRLRDPRQEVDPLLLPNRLSVFGVSYLPPFHLEVLDALAQRVPVYLFLLNPCRHYWFDILSDHQIGRIRAEYDDQAVDPAQLYLQRGNRLLASLGHIGKQFFDLIHQSPAQVTEAFVDTVSDSLLARLQQDILDMKDRHGIGESEPGEPPMPVSDGTLRVQSCHSPMREVEVLYDQLLDMLMHYEGLTPRDILVMTPDIASYAPYIHAIFGAADRSACKIPYSVADQSIQNQGPVVDSFLRLLGLVGGRLEASHVIALLQSPAVCNRFGLCPADLPTIEKWIQTAGIQWGWDGAHRKQHNLPGFKENTWRMGLDRLTLGYAMAGDSERLFGDILPYQGIGAGEGPVLGRFSAFAEILHHTLEELAMAASPTAWCDRLNRMLDRFFQVDPQSEYELQSLRRSIQTLSRIRGFDTPDEWLPFEVVKQFLTDDLGSISFESGFMAGGVTFCAMLPMRSIPSQVICLLGMNYDAFPREQHEPGFNLIAADPRSGDRSKRNDDRYLFLETLISARKVLYLSYVGRDIQDNAPIPPSVVVEELIEYVTEGFGIPHDQLVTHHPLHGFSPTYFDGNQPLLFSYSKDNLAAAEQLTLKGKERHFFEAPLDPPEATWRRCRWEQLAAFWAGPARYLLEQRLGLWLREKADILSDRELFTLDALQRYQVSQRLFAAVVRGKSREQIYRAVRAGGQLPHGTVGKIFYDKMNDEVMDYLGALAEHIGDHQPDAIPVDLDRPPFFAHGTIQAVYPTARIVCRLGRMRPRDLLGAFIHHLAMLSSPIGTLPRKTVLICKNEVWHFGAVEAPGDTLDGYLAWYWQGMHQPLPFFCGTSFEYAQQLLVKGRSTKEAMSAATARWQGNDFLPGESEDPYFSLCFGDSDPLGTEFREIALAIFSPVLAAGSRICAGGPEK